MPDCPRDAGFRTRCTNRGGRFAWFRPILGNNAVVNLAVRGRLGLGDSHQSFVLHRHSQCIATNADCRRGNSPQYQGNTLAVCDQSVSAFAPRIAGQVVPCLLFVRLALSRENVVQIAQSVAVNQWFCGNPCLKSRVITASNGGANTPFVADHRHQARVSGAAC